MVAEVTVLVFAVIGILSILRFLIFKFISYREEKFTLVIPVFSEDEEVFWRIENLREFCEFCGIHKKYTVVIINYGARKWFLEKLEELYGYYGFLKIVDSVEAGDALKEIIS